MRKTGIILAVLVLAGGMNVNLRGVGPALRWNLGPRPALGDANDLVPPEATGFSGTVLGQVVGKGKDPVVQPKWLFFTMKVIKVVNYDAKNKVEISAAALTDIWKVRTANVGPAANAQALPELVAGDMVLVTCFQNEAHLRQTRVIAYKPGEDEPNCYAFLKKVEKGNQVSVTLRKILDVKTVTLPLEKDADGKMVPKADLLAAVNGFQEKAVVMVQLDRNNVLASIKAYEPPLKGEFVKVTTQKVGEKTLQAVEIKDDSGAAQTLPLSAKNAADLPRMVRDLKAGAAILYRTESDDKGTWLTDIRPPS